jgi:hypothetical protein
LGEPSRSSVSTPAVANVTSSWYGGFSPHPHRQHTRALYTGYKGSQLIDPSAVGVTIQGKTPLCCAKKPECCVSLSSPLVGLTAVPPCSARVRSRCLVPCRPGKGSAISKQLGFNKTGESSFGLKLHRFHRINKSHHSSGSVSPGRARLRLPAGCVAAAAPRHPPPAEWPWTCRTSARSPSCWCGRRR